MVAQLLFVKASGGSDLNDGASWDTAKATIQSAHDALPGTGANPGGVIMCGPGDHAAGTVVTKAGVEIVGLGQRATRITVGSGDSFGVHFNGNFIHGGVRNLRVVSTSNTTSHGGVLIDVAESLRLVDVTFQGFGFGLTPAAAAANAADAGPYGLKVRGDNSQAFSDWHEFRSLEFFQVGRGFIGAGGGANGKFLGGTWRDCKAEAVYLHRDWTFGGSSGPSNAKFWFFGSYFKASFGTTDNYLVRLDANPAGSTSIAAMFVGCQTEIITGESGHHFYVDAGSNIINSHLFVGPSGRDAVNFGPLAADNKVTPMDMGNNNVFTVQAGATNNQVWKQATPAALGDLVGYYGAP